MQQTKLYSIASSARASSGWHVETESLGGLEVDDQIELHRRLHRKFLRFRTTQNAIKIRSSAAEQVPSVGSVGKQASFNYIDALRVADWQKCGHEFFGIGVGEDWSVATDRRDRSSGQINAVVLITADCMLQSQFQHSRGNKS